MSIRSWEREASCRAGRGKHRSRRRPRGSDRPCDEVFFESHCHPAPPGYRAHYPRRRTSSRDRCSAARILHCARKKATCHGARSARRSSRSVPECRERRPALHPASARARERSPARGFPRIAARESSSAESNSPSAFRRRFDSRARYLLWKA